MAAKQGGTRRRPNLLVEGVIGGIGPEFQWLRDSLSLRIDGLEEKIAALEASPVRWVGTWHSAMRVPRNALITDRGSLWLALTDAAEGVRPGTGSEYRLVVKAGRAPR